MPYMEYVGRVLLETTNEPSLWGDKVVSLVGPHGNVTTTCSVNPKPNVRDMVHNSTVAMLAAWCIAGACAGAALVICFLHIHQLDTFASTARRKNFTGVVLMAPVFAITNYLAMFFPRGAAMFELLQHIYEAQALYCFGALLLDLASDGETDNMVAREIILAKMAVQEPKKLDASPPLCFLAPCVKPVTVDGKRLDRLMAGLHVFGLVVPSCAVAKLWITLEAQNQYILYISKIVLLLVENVAMSYTLYCLFQLYVSTHDILHHYKPTDKFVAIKAILGIAVLQSMIIKVVCGKFLSKNSYFTVEMMADFWSNFALCCESIILAIGHKKAYPSGELEDTNGTHAARQKAARAHAMEMLALPPADGHHGHGGGKGLTHDSHVDAEGGHANGGAHAAPSTAAAVIDVGHSGAAALEQWTPDMDAEHWPASPGQVTTQPPPPIPTGRPNMYSGGTGSARIPAFPQ